MQEEDDSDSGNFHDRITEAVLDGSAYQRASVKTYRWFSAPVPDRLKWQAVLLFSLAAIYPVIRLLPTSVKQAYFGTKDIAATSPTIALLAGACILFTTLGATGHLGAIYLRFKWESDMTDRRALELVSLEETASLLAFGTAGLGVFATHFFATLGFSGSSTLSEYGLSPYELSGSALTVQTVAVTAVVLGTILYIVGYLVDIRLDEEDIRY